MINLNFVLILMIYKKYFFCKRILMFEKWEIGYEEKKKLLYKIFVIK